MHTFFLFRRGLGSGGTLISCLLVLLSFITKKIKVIIILSLSRIKSLLQQGQQQ
jgi:hypothetical protein